MKIFNSNYSVEELFDDLMNSGLNRDLFDDKYDKIIDRIRGASSDSEKFEKLLLELIPILGRHYFNRSGGDWNVPNFPIVPELRKFKEDRIAVPVGITDGDLKRIQEEFVDSLSWVALIHESRGFPITDNHQVVEYDKLPKILLNEAKVRSIYRNDEYFQICLLLSLHEIGHLCLHWEDLIKNLIGTYDPKNTRFFIADSTTKNQEEEAWQFCKVILDQFLKYALISGMQKQHIDKIMLKEIKRNAEFKAKIEEKYERNPSKEKQHRRIDPKKDMDAELDKMSLLKAIEDSNPMPMIGVHFDESASLSVDDKLLFLNYINALYKLHGGIALKIIKEKEYAIELAKVMEPSR